MVGVSRTGPVRSTGTARPSTVRSTGWHRPRRASHETRRAGAGLDRNLVLGIERKEVAHANAAARAERQAFELRLLVQGGWRAIHRSLRLGRQVADGKPADLHAGIEIALDQCRRGAEDGRDIVESLARGARRRVILSIFQ